MSDVFPRHIAVVMDGNGRWAKKRMLPRTAGHKAGAKAVRKLLESCVRHNIQALTLFAFSSENWQRPEREVNTLMSLFIEHLQKELPLFQKHQIKFQLIGEIGKFSPELQLQIHQTTQATVQNTGLVLTIAASYGGRWDLVRAMRELANEVVEQRLTIEQISEEYLAKYMCLADLPEPDLFIRTSGEQRISNFLLWQLAYTELYFTETLWPDFDEANFDAAIAWFKERQRRFGKTAEQLVNS